MNNLLQFYDSTSAFAESHRMIAEFGVLGSEEEIGSVDFDYRSMQLVVSSSNISRELNSPTFRLNFSLIVMDKTVASDPRARLLSTEENIFVIGQYQDHMLQLDNDVEFEDVEVVSINDSDDYVITVAYCDFGVNFSRKGYNNISEEIAVAIKPLYKAAIIFLLFPNLTKKVPTIDAIKQLPQIAIG